MDRWYVVQVSAGREELVLSFMRQFVVSGVLKDCFVPKYRTQQKIHSVWHEVERSLIPGYVIAVSAQPAKLESELRGVPAFTRLLRNEEGFMPLAKDEAAWFEAFAGGRDHVVAMSSAVKEGDSVTITDGPLREHAACITRIDRRRSTAYVEIRFLGRVKEIPVGLRIVAKRSG